MKPRHHARWALAALVAAALAGCGSSKAPTVPDHPVWLLATLKSPDAAWAAALQTDQPLLILGQAVYGLSPQCVPQRYFSQQDGARQLASQVDQRLLASGLDDRRLGSAADSRQQGSAADGRQLGSGADGRLQGSQADGRQMGSGNDQRLTGAAQDARSFGGDARGRNFGADDVRRAFGADASELRCRLASSAGEVVITGAASRQGYLYSARLRGAMDRVFLY